MLQEDFLKKRHERGINIMDLLWSIIHAWRALVIGALICAIGIVGLKYVNDRNVYSKENDKLNETTNHIDAQMTEEDQEIIKAALAQEQRVQSKKDYLQNSIYMNLDASAVNKVSLVYDVKVESEIQEDEEKLKNACDDLINAYVTYVEKGGIQSDLYNQIGQRMETWYLSELISASALLTDEGGQLVVTVMGEDDKQAAELADKVAEIIVVYQEKIQERVGEHRLVEIDRYDYIEADNIVESAQNTQKDLAWRLQQDLDTQIAAFSAEQEALYTSATRENEKEKEKEELEMPRLDIRYLVLGFCVGVILMCAWVGMRYIFSTRIHRMEELRELYGIRIFAILTLQGKRRFLERIDKWIDSLQKKNEMPMEVQLPLALSSICNLCKKKNIQNLILASTFQISDDEENIVEDILAKLKESGVNAEYKENIARTTEALCKASETGNVILFEKENVSKYIAVEEEILLCIEQEANLIGLIGLA